MSNDNQKDRYVVTIEQWDGDGGLAGTYLVSLLKAGQRVPLDGRICGTKDEALDVASDFMAARFGAIFQDNSEGGDS